MTWDIKPGKEQEYYNFIVGEFLPKANKEDFSIVDAWVTVYGNRPQILVGAFSPDLKTARQILNSQEWASLRSELENFVDNFENKLVKSKRGFQF